MERDVPTLKSPPAFHNFVISEHADEHNESRTEKSSPDGKPFRIKPQRTDSASSDDGTEPSSRNERRESLAVDEV